MTNDPKNPPPDPSQIVVYLEEMLDRARRLEVQILIASAGCYDPSTHRFSVHVGIGALPGVQGLPVEQRRAAYHAVLRGIEAAASEVQRAMELDVGVLQ